VCNPQSASMKPEFVDGSRRSVFVIDDDASVRDSLGVLLRTLGFDVVTHESGTEMLADERRHNAGCFIVDHHMPGMDGLEMLSVLGQQGIRTPAILITGRSDASIAARAVAIGVKAVLEKPFAIARLVDLLQSSLGQCQ